MYEQNDTEQRGQSDTETDHEESESDQDREVETEPLENSRWFTRFE